MLFVFVFSFFSLNTKDTFSYSEHGSNLKVSPEYPLPGAEVSASFSAPGLDMSTALITWRLNGSIIQQAYGKKNVKFKVGKIGEIYKISVFARDAKGKTASKSKILQIADVSIVWEGNTYTPPFYRGRALQSQGASVTVVAVPSVTKSNGVLYDKKDLFYEWMLNNSTIPSVVGKGVYFANFTNPKPFESFKIVLKIKDSQGKTRTVRKLIIPTTQPKIMLYEDDPYAGIRYDKSIGDKYDIRSKEVALVAEPFYMSTENRFDKKLDYVWTISNQEYNNKGTIILGSNGGFGSTNLNLTIQNNTSWLQNARKSVKINFGQEERYKWKTDNNSNTTPL